jgi:hypothetical protein
MTLWAREEERTYFEQIAYGLGERCTPHHRGGAGLGQREGQGALVALAGLAPPLFLQGQGAQVLGHQKVAQEPIKPGAFV